MRRRSCHALRRPPHRISRSLPGSVAHRAGGAARGNHIARPNGVLSTAGLIVRIHLPPAESHQRTELGEFRPREGGFPMVSSRSFGNGHLIDRLAAGIAGAARRISTDSLRSRSALFYPSVRARPVAPRSLTVWRRVSHRALRCGPPACGRTLKIPLKGTAAQCRFSVDLFMPHPGLSERLSSRL
jgi:hypothetical protein